MFHYIPYGEIFHDITISDQIIHDGHLLANIIYDLNEIGIKFIAHNSSGIICKYIVSLRDITNDIEVINKNLYSMLDRIDNLTVSVENIEEDLNTLLEDNISIKKEITQEFYLLYNKLPEDIKKKIKIYINDYKR